MALGQFPSEMNPRKVEKNDTISCKHFPPLLSTSTTIRDVTIGSVTALFVRLWNTGMRMQFRLPNPRQLGVLLFRVARPGIEVSRHLEI